MKDSRLKLIVCFITLLLAVFVVTKVMLKSRGFNEASEGIGEQRGGLAVDVNGSWPMFHGEPNLAGRCQNELPDLLSVIWKFQTGDEVKSSPAIDEAIVYIGSSDGNVYAIDLKTGEQVWSYKTDGAVEATACVVDDLVFIGSSDSFLYALDKVTGELKWKSETGGQILGSANRIDSEESEALRIIVGSYDSRLYCLNSADGKVVWIYETDNYVNGTPAVENERIAFGGCDGMIHIVSAGDGSSIKRIDGGTYIAGSSAILEGKVYVGNYENTFMKADIIKGEIVWKYTGSDTGYYSSPSVSNDVVVVGGRDNRIHCVDAGSGKKKWTFQTLGEVDSSPIICSEKVIVGSGDGRLYMLRLSDGSKLWSFEIGQAISSSPAVVGNIIVVGCDDGYVYAFGPGQ
jgi:outer membrane protein assembly factor BamB